MRMLIVKRLIWSFDRSDIVTDLSTSLISFLDNNPILTVKVLHGA
jgi:hypothetical protein